MDQVEQMGADHELRIGDTILIGNFSIRPKCSGPDPPSGPDAVLVQEIQTNRALPDSSGSGQHGIIPLRQSRSAPPREGHG